MPGGTPEAYKHIEPIVQAVAAQVHFVLSPRITACPACCPEQVLGALLGSSSSSLLETTRVVGMAELIASHLS